MSQTTLFRATERSLRHPACTLSCAAAIAALAFVLVSARALPLLGGILATLAIGGVGPWIAVRGATAEIAWDRRRYRVGDTLTATINRRSILPWWRPQITMQWPDAEPTAAAVDGGGDRIVVVPRRRGRFPRTAPLLTSDQPFGVMTARRALAMPAPVIVWPVRGDVRVPAGLVAAAGIGRESSERITGHSGDSIGARDYRPGDSVRSIHWPLTARRDALVVRERPGTAAAVVRLVVDHRIRGHHSSGGREGVAGESAERLLDAVVGIAFAIVESWRPRGVTFELAWPGREPLSPRTPADFTAMLDELACLEPLAPDLEPVVTSSRLRPVDLEIVLATPGREGPAAAVEVAARAQPERVWIVVGGSSEPPRPRRGREGSEMVLHVPLEPDPIGAVDAIFASLNHDPDARRTVIAEAVG